MARGAARALHCDGEAVTLGPCAEGQFVKRQGRKLVGAEITGSGAAWGDITGTLSSQTDLQGELDGKEDAGAAASAVSAHEAEGDPHTGYLTAAEGDAAYEPIGEVAAHEALADPHPGYLTTAEGDARYSLDGHTHPGGGSALDAWPVGSVYIAVDSTSPATRFGGGTWAAFGAGRMLVGLNSGDTDFDTAEETGGAKTSSAVVNHTHPVVVDDPQHAHVENSNNSTTGGLRGWGAADTSTNTSTATGYSTAPASTGITATTQNPAGGVASFSLMNPYIVVYMWKRTA